MTSQTVTPNTEVAILGHLLQSRENMSRDVAEYLLSIDLQASDIDRMNLLSERARRGTLTGAETAELDSYLHVGSLLSILQSRARRFLKSEGACPGVREPASRRGSLAKGGESVRVLPHPAPALPASLPD